MLEFTSEGDNRIPRSRSRKPAFSRTRIWSSIASCYRSPMAGRAQTSRLSFTMIDSIDLTACLDSSSHLRRCSSDPVSERSVWLCAIASQPSDAAAKQEDVVLTNCRRETRQVSCRSFGFMLILPIGIAFFLRVLTSIFFEPELPHPKHSRASEWL